MATASRRPLANRPLQVSLPHKSAGTTSGSKRARSPDIYNETNTSHPGLKRMRPVIPSAISTRETIKEKKHIEREQQKAEFRDKYTRAFPSFIFYFDEDSVGAGPAKAFKAKIELLGGKTDEFFSNAISYFITNRALPKGDISADKENNPKIKSIGVLKSPIKLKGRPGEDPEYKPVFDVVAEAVRQNLKIWNTTKLDSVLTRLLNNHPSTSALADSRLNTLARPTVTNTQRSLTRLLQSEKIHGTMERDPTQKRHDFRYFSRNSKFVLIEDMRQELATIASHEYPVLKGREKTSKVSWPVLHCHPRSRGPFFAYDDRERKRWEKLQQADAEQKDERAEYRNRIQPVEVMRRRAEANLHVKRIGDLRRSVSMNNLHRRATLPISREYTIDLDADGDVPDSANASGFLASGASFGYIAASGNSVSITSTTGQTSNAEYTLRNVQLPSALSGRMKQQIITSRKFSSSTTEKFQNETAVMGPPTAIPQRQPVLKKSKSTNTLKLPKREEGSKPGYCESCRVKFEDFKMHISGRKHRKFAGDAANFLQLDCVLARVQRRTRLEIEEERMKKDLRRRYYCGRIQEDTICFSHELDTILPVRQHQQDTEMNEGFSSWP